MAWTTDLRYALRRLARAPGFVAASVAMLVLGVGLSVAMYSMLRGVVLQDWTDSVMAEQRTAAVRTLAKKYTVKHEATTP